MRPGGEFVPENRGRGREGFVASSGEVLQSFLMDHADVVVVGAGLIGMAIARELHRQGIRVEIYEQGRMGCEASWAAAGMLSAVQVEPRSPLRPLALASARLYGPFVQQLREETGMPVEYREQGTLVLGDLTETPAEYERLDDVQVRELEPNLHCDKPVWRVPDGSIDNRQLVQAMIAAVRRSGIQVHENCGVRAVRRDGAGLLVTTDAGHRTASSVINAAGAWAGAFEAPVPTPVRPRKGQMLCLRVEPRTVRNVLVSHIDGHTYMVPRGDGRVLIGSTLEDVGFHRRPDPGVLADLRLRGEGLIPALRKAPMVENWAGLRPGSRDQLPILGPTQVPGYWMATGHFRDGVLLTPVTSRLIAEWFIRGEVADLDITPFRSTRFNN